jgi:hypothetical protein
MPLLSADPESVVQRQFEAYNAHDVDALVATYADDAEQFAHPSKLLASGSAQLRDRYAARFRDDKPHAALVTRTVLGNIVVDHEEVTSRSPQGIVRAAVVAIYEVKEGEISRAWFISALMN